MTTWGAIGVFLALANAFFGGMGIAGNRLITGCMNTGVAILVGFVIWTKIP